ncbi:hypothetical protein KKF84_05320 [Myxococcota bacterium]|nr:hypothetical protein [Myxococcota bacterium]
MNVEIQEVPRALARDMVLNFLEDNKSYLKKYIHSLLHGELREDLFSVSKTLFKDRAMEFHEFHEIEEVVDEVIGEMLSSEGQGSQELRTNRSIEDNYFAGLAPEDLFEYIDKLYERYHELGGDEDEINRENVPALMRVIMILSNIFEHELKDFDNAYETLMNGFDIEPGNRDILKRLVNLSGKMSFGEQLVDTFESISEVMEDPKTRSDLLYSAGRVYLEVMGDAQSAKIVLHLALEHNPGNRRARNLLELVSI